MAVSHVKTVTVADGTATSVVRPSDWNSAHIQYMTLGGNTAGASVLSGSNIVLAGGSNVTLSGDGSTVNIIGASGGGTAYQFDNGNGVTFGTTGSTVTASVQTAYQSQGAYLTTAQPPGAYLTTAQPVGAYLTTARASNDGVGLNSALTANGVSATVNSSGLSLNFPAFLTTAANSTHTHSQYQATGAYLTTAAQSGHSHGAVSLSLSNLSGSYSSGSAGLTLSLTGNTVGAGGGAAISAGTQSQNTGTIIFSNANGLSFGLSAGTLTGSFGASDLTVSNNLTLSVGTGASSTNVTILGPDLSQYITTAANSSHSHGNPTLYLTNLTGTTASASNGLSLSLSAAAPGAGGGVAIVGSNATYTSGSAVFTGAGAITVGSDTGQKVVVSGPSLSVLTAGANITLSSAGNTISIIGAALSAAGTNGAITGGSITVNTSGVSINLPAYLTTAMGSNEPHIQAVTVGGSQWTNGTLVFTGSRMTVTASNGSVMFMADDDIDAVYVAGNTAGAAGTISSGTLVFAGGNGITLSRDAQTISIVAGNYLTTAANSTHTHSQYQSTGAYLTTARASNDGIGLNTAATGVTWTVNSSGISLNAGAYLTTAAQSGHSHGNPTLYLTNLTGTTASASNGLSLSLSAAAPGGGGGVAISASGGSQSTGTVIFSNSNGVSFGYNAGTITATVVPGAAAGIGAISASNMTATSGTVGFAGSNAITVKTSAGNVVVVDGPALTVLTAGANITLSSAGSTISIIGPSPGGGAAIPNYFAFIGDEVPQARALITNITALTQRPVFFPFEIGGSLSANEIHWTMSRSTSGSNHFTVHAGLYSYSNSTRIDLISSGSYSFSATNTASISGIKGVEIPCPLTSFGPGQYILGMIFSATATASMNYSLMGGTTANPANVNVMITGADAYHTYTSHPSIPFWGRFTTTTDGLPDSVGWSQVIDGFTGASSPLPAHFLLVNHY